MKRMLPYRDKHRTCGWLCGKNDNTFPSHSHAAQQQDSVPDLSAICGADPMDTHHRLPCLSPSLQYGVEMGVYTVNAAWTEGAVRASVSAVNELPA